jgi:hypothetical protein
MKFVPVTLPLSKGPALTYLVLLACNGEHELFAEAGLADDLRVGQSFYEVVRQNRLSQEQLNRLLRAARARFNIELRESPTRGSARYEARVGGKFPCTELAADEETAVSHALIRSQLARMRLQVPEPLIHPQQQEQATA